MIDARRDRRTRSVAAWAAAALALVVHAAFAVTVHAVGTTAPVGQRVRPPIADGISSGCIADVALATGARTAMCFAPWQYDVGECVGAAKATAWIELASCQTQRDGDVAQVAVIDSRVVERLPSLDPEKLLAAVPDRAPPEPTPPESVPPEKQPQPSQVVETAKPQDQKAPEHARFVAEYDTTVAKQTVARGAVNEPMVARSKPSELTPMPTPNQASVKEHVLRPHGQPTQSPTAGKLAMRAPGAGASAEVARDARAMGATVGDSGSAAKDGTLSHKGQGAIAQSRRDRTASDLGPGGAAGAPYVPNLNPTAEVLERAAGGGSVDHLEDVETGETTALNATRWVHASFFNRLKRQVAQNWNPAAVWRRSDPRGQVYGTKTRVTEVRVSLSTQGQLAKIAITTPSGVGDLDDEALRAFRAAGPFPNPPVDLAGADHLITFAFAFYFEIGASRTSWRVIRPM